MAQTVLVTGGAGFIGSYVVDLLLEQGHDVRVLDALIPQVHGDGQQPPDYLDPRADLRVGNVNDPAAVAHALDGVDAVIHLAALVGVGQSMYEMVRYTDGNQRGTAVLMEALTQRRDQVRRLVVASSMSIYGEGLYRDADGQVVRDAARSPEQVEAHHWEPLDASGRSLEPIPSDESTPVTLASNYALGKYAQEQLTLIAGRAYDIPTVPLRFFNVYGPRQALSNPYTGVLAIFASRLLNDAPPLVFEDGQQRRDFVHVTDVARAVYLALTTPAGQVAGQCFNIGSGHSYTVEELGLRLAEVMDKPIAPRLTGEFRVGDIRHCFADIAKARDLLGYEPQVTMEQGMADLADWLQGQRADDRVESARLELAGKGLTR